MLGTGLDDLTEEQYIDLITSEELQRVANKYFDIDRYLRVVLYPEKDQAAE